MKTIREFQTWLRAQAHTLDQFAQYADPTEAYYLSVQVEEIVDSARRFACRFMADPGECPADIHNGLAFISRLLRELPNASTLLTVKQAAEKLNVSPRAVYDLVESGRLRCLRVGTGRGTIRIRPADLDRIPMESARRLT